MQKKIVIAAVIAALAIGGWFAWTILRFTVVYKMKVQGVMEKKIGRFPDSNALVTLPDALKEAARDAKVPEEGLSVSLALEGRDEGPVRFYYLLVHIEDAKQQSIDVSHRVESQNQLLADIENLEQHGIKVKK